MKLFNQQSQSSVDSPVMSVQWNCTRKEASEGLPIQDCANSFAISLKTKFQTLNNRKNSTYTAVAEIIRNSNTHPDKGHAREDE